MDLLREPGKFSKGLTHSKSFCKNAQVLAVGEMEAEVLLESFFCLLECSLSFCPLTTGEPRVDVLLPVAGPLKALFTGIQVAVSEATRQPVTVGTDPALSSEIQG